MRENRNLFLHKGSWHNFKGYAYSQLSKLEDRANKENPKRVQDIAVYGYDTKFAYHIVRLLLEVEQILTEYTLDLERNSSVLKAIRKGEWTLDRVKSFMYNKEIDLESVYNTSELRYKPDEQAIKALLMECLEMHYGKIATQLHSSSNLLFELKLLTEKYS